MCDCMCVYVQVVPVKRADFTELRGRLELELNSESILPPQESSNVNPAQNQHHHGLSSRIHNHLLLHNLEPSARETPV